MPVHDWTKVEAGVFHDFHHVWISSIRHALNSGALPPDYYATADQVAGPGNPAVLGLQAASRGQPPALPRRVRPRAAPGDVRRARRGGRRSPRHAPLSPTRRRREGATRSDVPSRVGGSTRPVARGARTASRVTPGRARGTIGAP